jgi:hypothetical protein
VYSVGYRKRRACVHALKKAQLLALQKLVKLQPDYPFPDERNQAIKQLEAELSAKH